LRLIPISSHLSIWHPKKKKKNRTPHTTTTFKMTYRIFQIKGLYYFQCRTSLAIRHGAFKTRAEAKTAADAYVKDW
jgi:hypothetical protein